MLVTLGTTKSYVQEDKKVPCVCFTVESKDHLFDMRMVQDGAAFYYIDERQVSKGEFCAFPKAELLCFLIQDTWNGLVKHALLILSRDESRKSFENLDVLFNAFAEVKHPCFFNDTEPAPFEVARMRITH